MPRFLTRLRFLNSLKTNNIKTQGKVKVSFIYLIVIKLLRNLKCLSRRNNNLKMRKWYFSFCREKRITKVFEQRGFY